MSKIRPWIFRVLVLAGIGCFVYSWISPWWGCYILALGMDDIVQIFPFALENNLGGWGGYLGDIAEMPAFFTPLMWLYFGLVIGVLLFAIWKMNKSIRLFGRNFNLSRLLVGIAGLSYAIVILIFYFYAKMRVEAIGVKFIGMTYINPTVIIHTDAHTGLREGLWWACGVAPFFVVLALLRNLIAGRPKAASPDSIEA